ncbi:MAG: amidohydrolase family protein [Nitrospinota bacterium]
MKRLLVKALCVATLDDSAGTITRGAVLVEDGIVTAVGPYDELFRQGPLDEEIGSLEDDLLMPGLTNAHHHSARYSRDGIPDEPLEHWLPFVLAFYRSDLSDEEIFLNTAWSCIELIRSRCTSVVDFHSGIWPQKRLGIPPVVRAYREIGLRVGVCVSIGDINRLYYEGDDQVVNNLPAEARRGRSSAHPPA